MTNQTYTTEDIKTAWPIEVAHAKALMSAWAIREAGLARINDAYWRAIAKAEKARDKAIAQAKKEERANP